MSLLGERLLNQQLLGTRLRTAVEMVSWFGAMQAQDYAGARWAIGLRASVLTDADVAHAFDTGEILRTHVLRPTWHFVAPADIRWLLALTAPRVQAVNASYCRQFSLDTRVLTRARRILERALDSDACLTRTELGATLATHGIKVDGTALGLVVMHAELEGVICSGPRRDKQFTYALLDRRVAPTPARDPDDALGELTRRYFSSHGPATVRDFAWWSGLTQRACRRGIDVAGASISSEVVGDLEYWRTGTRRPPTRAAATTVHLVPNYDESLIAYQDRGLAVPPIETREKRERDPFMHHVLLDGRIAGSWSRRVVGRATEIDVACYNRPTRALRDGVERAVQRLGTFLGVPTRLRSIR